ncbi:hypothetical protein EVAR_40788_1 [Eumeta japonica]|uniref:Uncharacterized protein n=1 Tax=Eumeta variegata TaxID=151549 RepID=A0A4C1X6D0_EUMVA|nr:hypothetical protein EVAR_40788_1 [Eumeta japonica]
MHTALSVFTSNPLKRQEAITHIRYYGCAALAAYIEACKIADRVTTSLSRRYMRPHGAGRHEIRRMGLLSGVVTCKIILFLLSTKHF